MFLWFNGCYCSLVKTQSCSWGTQYLLYLINGLTRTTSVSAGKTLNKLSAWFTYKLSTASGLLCERMMGNRCSGKCYHLPFLKIHPLWNNAFEWIPRRHLTFEEPNYPQYFGVTCRSQKQSGLKSVSAISSSRQTGPWKVFNFSHIVWKKYGWWVPKGYSGKNFTSRSGTKPVHICQGMSLILRLFSNWLQFYSVLIRLKSVYKYKNIHIKIKYNSLNWDVFICVEY